MYLNFSVFVLSPEPSLCTIIFRQTDIRISQTRENNIFFDALSSRGTEKPQLSNGNAVRSANRFALSSHILRTFAKNR